MNVIHRTYAVCNLWPRLGFLQVCFIIEPGGVCKQNMWATFSLSQWRLHSPLLKTRLHLFPSPISAHTFFFSTLYSHLLGVGNSAILFWAPLTDDNADQSGPWPKRASWIIVTQCTFSQPFRDFPCVASSFMGDSSSKDCACSCNFFPIGRLFHYSWAHIILIFECSSYFWEIVPPFLNHMKRRELSSGMKGKYSGITMGWRQGWSPSFCMMPWTASHTGISHPVLGMCHFALLPAGWWSFGASISWIYLGQW